MQRETTLISYLIIGISLILLCTSCNIDVEPIIKKGRFFFVNKTTQTVWLEVDHNSQKSNTIFKIEPGDSIFTESEAEIRAYPFMSDRSGQIHDGRSVTIKFSDGKCTYYEFDQSQYEGIYDLSIYENYDESIFSSSFYELTYFIDEKDYELSEECW